MEQLQVQLQQVWERRAPGDGWPWQPMSGAGSRRRRRRPGEPQQLLPPGFRQLQSRTEELAASFRANVERLQQQANLEVDRLRSRALDAIDSLALASGGARGASPLPFACLQVSPPGRDRGGLGAFLQHNRVKVEVAGQRKLGGLAELFEKAAKGEELALVAQAAAPAAADSAAVPAPPSPPAAAEATSSPMTSPFGDKGIAVVTTASLPWLTGSAVNPLLRAAHLVDKCRQVTLVVPWLPPAEQPVVHSNKLTFETPADQEEYVRSWLAQTTGRDPGDKLRVAFYPSRYSPDKHSILALGDVTQCVPDDSSDLVVLEEPEHLTWYHHGRRWTDAFPRVIGIAHTNYIEYASREPGGAVLAWALYHVNRWMCRVHCDQVVKLSDAVQLLPRSSTCNVNGVADRFLRIGERCASRGDTEGLYYIAKMQWGKGYAELLNLLRKHPFALDSYGSGGDAVAIVEAARQAGLPIKFHGHLEGQGRYDHGTAVFEPYRAFLNPSISEVVATTTAEALAMNKHVVVPEHPSNAFFASFPNCHVYNPEDETGDDFAAKLRQALAVEPAVLSAEQRHALSWEAATQRFLDIACAAPPKEGLALEALDNVLGLLHKTLSAVPLLRVAAGAGPVSFQDSALNRLTRQQVEEHQQMQLASLGGSAATAQPAAGRRSRRGAGGGAMPELPPLFKGLIPQAS